MLIGSRCSYGAGDTVWIFGFRSWLLYQEQSFVAYRSMICGSDASKSNERASWSCWPGCFLCVWNWHFARMVAPAPQARIEWFRYLNRYLLAVGTEGEGAAINFIMM